ncbi:AMP-binding protein [Amaricoccus macauensis]|uniref:AMP-binding protein n=1 Tax=Amaricoccus macauensis TaxID=57001 RepID=UPI003C7D4089
MFILNDAPATRAPNPAIMALAEHGHRIALHLSETEKMLGAILNLRQAGSTIFPIHPDIPHARALDMAAHAGCDRFVAGDGTILETDTRHDGARVPEGGLIHMTSGTTGAPKRIERSWGEIGIEIASYAEAFTAPDGMTPIIACPITHSYGLIPGVMVGLHRGRTPVVIEGINPKYILRRMREVERPLLYTSPAMLYTLARLLPADAHLPAAMTSGTMLSRSWFDCIRSRVDRLFQQYGCSETGCVAINPDLQRADEIGYPLPHLAVGAGRSANRPAEITVETPRGMIGTGDLGYLAADGMLVFRSRLDDMINVAGLNVFPRDVEQAVLDMPGVEDALAFRMEDVLAGERVALVYTGNAREDELRAWCREHLAGYQQPSVLRPVDRIPREANGKVNRRNVASGLAEAGI